MSHVVRVRTHLIQIDASFVTRYSAFRAVACEADVRGDVTPAWPSPIGCAVHAELHFLYSHRWM